MERTPKAALLTTAGGAMLGVSLFLPWYVFFEGATFYAPLQPEDEVQTIPSEHNTAWEAFQVVDVVLAVAAVCALIGTALAPRMPRGWGWFIFVVAGCGLVAGITAAVFRPIEPAPVDYGFFVGLFGAALIAAGGVLGTAGELHRRSTLPE